MSNKIYALPMVLGDQYILSNVLRETEDTVVYAAMQKDMRREVQVESLCPAAMQDPAKVSHFLETARIQASIPSKVVASTLELIQAEGSWHLTKERIKGEPLDIMVSTGRKLPALVLCNLFLELCHAAIYLDIRGVNNRSMHPEDIYLLDHGFRFENLTCAGKRSSTATSELLSSLAADLLPLLDAGSYEAFRMEEILKRVRYGCNWTPMSVLLLDEELVRLQADIIALIEGDSAESDAGARSAVEPRCTDYLPPPAARRSSGTDAAANSEPRPAAVPAAPAFIDP